MSFRYLRDPLFLFSVLVYCVNRLLLKPNCTHWFLHSYLNDMICVPIFVPAIAFLAKRMRIRQHDRAPTAAEVVLPVLVWAVLFEIVFPNDPFWGNWVVGDPFDVVWYCVGAVLANVVWRRFYVTQ